MEGLPYLDSENPCTQGMEEKAFFCFCPDDPRTRGMGDAPNF